MLDCFSLVAIVVTIVNKHHIRKIDSKIMIILVFCFITNRYGYYSKPSQSSTVERIVLAVSDTQPIVITQNGTKAPSAGDGNSDQEVSTSN